ncbi:MAG: 30S ribosomal protein S4 [Peptococcaceae bacterium]|nr:30S ribosomal protein S4 [Peptococcaceae bacterium]
MARYTGPACRLCRREGMKLFLKGDRCYTKKCAIEKGRVTPGQHGQSRKKATEYGVQLREKQKTKRIYGMMEGQFKLTFNRAERQKGVVGENFLSLLERRLDNVVYRLGFANSRSEARQLVRHNHYTLNGHKANIPSLSVRIGDQIAVKNKSKESPKFKEMKEIAAGRTVPAWLEMDAENLVGRIVALPARENIDIPVQEHLIVELYSR